MIITGPNAILGKLFNTTKNGSDTLDIKSDHHSIIAIIEPNNVPNKNPIIVSMHVIFICSNKLFWLKLKSVFIILDGLLIIKLSIIPLFANSSHNPTNPTTIII